MSAPKRYPVELRERAVKLCRSSRPRPTFRHLGEQLGVSSRGTARVDPHRSESPRRVAGRPGGQVRVADGHRRTR